MQLDFEICGHRRQRNPGGSHGSRVGSRNEILIHSSLNNQSVFGYSTVHVPCLKTDSENSSKSVQNYLSCLAYR